MNLQRLPTSRAESEIPKETFRDSTATRSGDTSLAFSPKPDWLDEDTYVRRIQPRLAGITISALASTLGVSEPYTGVHPRRLTLPAAQELERWQNLWESPQDGLTAS